MNNIKKINTPRSKQYVIAGLVMVAVLSWFVFLKPRPHSITSSQLPVGIRSQLDFRALYPPQTTLDGWTLVPGSAKIAKQDNGTTTLSFILRSGKADVTFSEQAYPDILVYDNLVNGINPYDETGTIYGKAALGKPKNANGLQTAVLKYGGDALIFAHPNHNLTTAEWRAVFNALQEIR